MDKRLILLNDEDNTVVACTTLAAGTALDLGSAMVVLNSDIALGHKLARLPIARGQKIIKYGAIIGSANRDIACGEHVHTHNVDSDYLPTYTLDGGKSYVQH